MYRIAIGDDDPIFLQALVEDVAACLRGDGLRQGEDFQITACAQAQTLLDALERGGEPFQLLLLDVEFGTVNGLDLAARLRENDTEFSLIYITNYREYVFDSFDTRPLHYLLKPPDREKLTALLREDYRRRVSDARLSLRAGGKHLTLAFRDIYAVEAGQHRVLFHLRDSVVEWPGSLSATASLLPGWCFCQCHFSYFVNLSHVTELVRYEARLDNGAAIPISKRCYKPALEQYFTFLKK